MVPRPATVNEELQPHEGPSETAIPAWGHRGLAHELQPHEGPSETNAGYLLALNDTGLQPHEGPSETVSEQSGVAEEDVLQPHEGPSETTTGAFIGSVPAASTSRGSV